MKEKSAPLVSIVTAAHNYGEFIGAALRSVLDQSFPEWECIVVDDASTDGTAGIVLEFCARDDRFKYVPLEHNVGVSAARNRGLAMARGRYIQFLDADDVLALRKLELEVAFLEEHPEVSVLYGDFIHFTGEPDLTRPGEQGADEKVSGAGEVVVARLLKGNFLRPVTVLFRSTVLATTGPFSEKLRYVEDLDLWFRMATAGFGFHFFGDPRCISGARVNPRGLSKNVPRMRGNLLPVLQRLWTGTGLSMKNRVVLLVRYTDHLFEMLFIHFQRPSLFPEERASFLLVLIPFAIVALPFWLISRPFRKRR